MFITGVLVALLVILCMRWCRDRKHRLQLFKRMGVPGPEPSLLLGNMGDDFVSKGMKYKLQTWTKQYGKLYGYYEGRNPVLVVSDPEHVKQIAVKEFHKFHSRKRSPFDMLDEDEQDIFNSQGPKWKRLRSIASLSFTARRMKEMSPLINNSVTDLLDLFEKRCDKGEPFDIHGDFGRLTTDVISSCAFGIDSGCIRDDSSKFLIESKKVFQSLEILPLRLLLGIPFMFLFPDFTNLMRHFGPIDRFLTIETPWLDAAAKQVLRDRQAHEGDEDRVDLVNLMLDANKKLASGKKLTPTVEDEDHNTEDSFPKTENNLKPLSETEMVAQMTLFMLAGYETTSTALGFTAYELALNPNVQEKLQAEIDNYFPEKDIKPDYGTVHKLPYLEAVLKEALRIHPVAPIGTTRKCFEETKLDDITVPAGMSVQLNMEDLHFNPELWGKYDPSKFVPERFLEDCQDAQQNMAWIPFGAGPRICLGMRFAQMEYKTAIVRLLKRFSIKRCASTKVPCPTKKNGVQGPSEGVHVRLERRR